MRLCKTQKKILNFLLHLWNLPQIFEHFKKKTKTTIGLIAYVFPKLETVKEVVS